MLQELGGGALSEVVLARKQGDWIIRPFCHFAGNQSCFVQLKKKIMLCARKMEPAEKVAGKLKCIPRL
jgi:hypothetical protein